MPGFEIIDARFRLLPGFSSEVTYGTRTCNARSATFATLERSKGAWAKARYLSVPCDAIYEPDWLTGTHVPTRFTAADGGALGVAGLWQPSKSTEESGSIPSPWRRPTPAATR